jgi:aldose 1-epimerase
MTPIVLHDHQSGSQARILPERGFNCYGFQAAVGSQFVDVLDAQPGFDVGTARPTRSGIPILFPFPNRIRGGKFQWKGREYQLPDGDHQGNAIHGFCFDREWRVVLSDEHTVVGEFQLSIDAADRVKQWPTDFLVQVRYTLIGSALRADVRIANAGDDDLPWGLGFHPYFALPLSANSRAEDCLVTVPASETWELQENLPTGERLPVDERIDLRTGQSLTGRTLDDVLTGLSPNEGRVETTIMDPQAGIQVRQTFDAIFRECVVFTPPNRSCICLEPYTCTTDAINLQMQDIDAGWRVLKPGDELRTWFQIDVGLIYA